MNKKFDKDETDISEHSSLISIKKQKKREYWIGI